MFSKETFYNKKILIYGLGLSGKSCLKYLNKYLIKNQKKIITELDIFFWFFIKYLFNLHLFISIPGLITIKSN